MSDFTFKKSEKLTESTQFGKLSRANNKIHGKFFLLLHLKNELGHPRLGLTVSKKAAKLSVERNRIKRVIREFFRLNKHTASDKDIVFIGRHKISDANNTLIRQDLEKLWEKLVTS